MVIKKSRSKFVATASLFLFLLLIVNNSYLNGIPPQESEAKSFYKEGVDLFKNGDYFKALENFSKVLTLTKDKNLQTDTYFYLSLVNYYIGEKASSIEWIKRVLENDPDKEISSLHPPEYIELFRQTKQEFVPQPKPEPEEEKKVVEEKPEPKRVEKKPETRTVAVKNGKKKGGGGTIILVILGLAVAGGVAALLLLKGKEEPTEGSIQVSSTPQGADIYLDGSNTGRKTNTTLTNVSVGTHTVKLLKDGYGDHEETVTVIGDQTVTVDVTLSAHTINVTLPTNSTNWTQGQEVQIKWTTGGGLAQFGSFRTNQAVNQAVQTARLNRQRINPSNSAVRQSNMERRNSNQERFTRSQFVSRRFAKIQVRSKSEGFNGRSGDLRYPRNSDLNRINRSLASSRNFTPLGDVNVQTLSNIKIELYQGNNVKEVIVPSASNTGSYDWTVTPSLSDASNYKVRVSCSTDEDVFGESAAFTISANVGKIKVTSIPPNAAIWLDGINTGQTTPATLNDITAGSHTIRLELERYQDWETTVTVTKNTTTNVPATLKAGAFTENFNDNVADHWKPASAVGWGGQWNAEGGFYKCKDGSYELSQMAASYYNLGAYSNFSYEASCRRVLSGGIWEVYGLAFRGNSDFSDFYVFDINPSDQNYSVWRWNGTWGNVVGWTSHSGINSTGWNTLKIEADGSNFSFYINGSLVESVNISGIPSEGKIGLWMWRYPGANNDEAHFDNVSLSLESTTVLTSKPIRTVFPKPPKPGENGSEIEIKKIKK